jgi:hypothetical protein
VNSSSVACVERLEFPDVVRRYSVNKIELLRNPRDTKHAAATNNPACTWPRDGVARGASMNCCSCQLPNLAVKGAETPLVKNLARVGGQARLPCPTPTCNFVLSLVRTCPGCQREPHPSPSFLRSGRRRFRMQHHTYLPPSLQITTPAAPT